MSKPITTDISQLGIFKQSQYTCKIHGDIGENTLLCTEADGTVHGPWCMLCISDMLNTTCRIAELVEEDECSTS